MAETRVVGEEHKKHHKDTNIKEKKIKLLTKEI